MQKAEERQLEASLDALIQRTASLKTSIVSFIDKLEREHEIMTWPTMLDSYALLTSELNSLIKQLKNDKMFPLRNYAVLPVLLSPDPDEQLERLTEGRVPVWNHETAPSYLRTKLEPEVEKRLTKMTERTGAMEALKKQANSFSSTLHNLLEAINTERDQFSNELGQKTQPPPTYSQEDTTLILTAINTGKNLRGGPLRRPQPSSDFAAGQGQGQQGGQGAGASGSQPPQQSMPGSAPGKAPSSMKPVMRGVANVHPYARP